MNWIDDVPMDKELRKALRAIRNAIVMIEKGEPDWRVLHLLNRVIKDFEEN